MIPTVCVYEGDCGTNINNIQTFAIQDKENSWLLSGEKDYVVNGVDSNLFLVFAKNISPNIKILEHEALDEHVGGEYETHDVE